jgi:hypothetical protein
VAGTGRAPGRALLASTEALRSNDAHDTDGGGGPVKRRNRAGFSGVLAVSSLLLAACSGVPATPSPGDVQQGFVGTWAQDDRGQSVLVLDEDGTFRAQDFPAALVCDGSGNGGYQLDACRSRPSTVSADGTWTVAEGQFGVVRLDSGEKSFATAYQHHTSFFGHDFVLGFYTGSLERPEPDYVFERVQQRAEGVHGALER